MSDLQDLLQSERDYVLSDFWSDVVYNGTTTISAVVDIRQTGRQEQESNTLFQVSDATLTLRMEDGPFKIGDSFQFEGKTWRFADTGSQETNVQDRTIQVDVVCREPVEVGQARKGK